MNPETGKYLIIMGLLIIVAGIILYFLRDKLHWIGRLPGDIRIEREDSRIYFPITTMILFSLLLSLAVRLFRKF